MESVENPFEVTHYTRYASLHSNHYAVIPASMPLLINYKYCYHPQLLCTITNIGTSNTICVDANDSYTVLYVSNKQRVTCSNSACHHNQSTCKHIQHLLSVIDSCVSLQEDIPSTLPPFATLLRSKEIVSTSPEANVPQLSHRPCRNIPFNLLECLSLVLHLA